MTDPPRPSLGRMIEFLRGLGYTKVGTYQNSTVCVRPGDDMPFLFKTVPLDEPIREIEFRMARKYLTERAIVSEADFDKFAAEAVSGQPA